MPFDSYSILIVLCVLVVLSYFFSFLATKIHVPSVLLLLGSGIGIKIFTYSIGYSIPQQKTILEILGIAGLIFIVLEAALDLKLERKKLRLISRAFFSAIALLGMTSILLAWIFQNYYGGGFQEALLHAIPFSVISSAIAIPSVQKLDIEKREFIIYESTFSDVLGIIFFNVLLQNLEGFEQGNPAVFFIRDIFLIAVISMLSTGLLIFMLNHSTSNARFFLAFAVLILTYSVAKLLHLPSLILVLCFGLVLNNFNLFNYPIVHRYLSFDKLSEVTKEMKLMTGETAFIIRTFFFLLFGFSIDISLLSSMGVIIMGVVIIFLTVIVRGSFLYLALRVRSISIFLIAPRGLISILLFYSIPESMREQSLTDGVLFLVIVSTTLLLPLGLYYYRKSLIQKSGHAIK